MSDLLDPLRGARVQILRPAGNDTALVCAPFCASSAASAGACTGAKMAAAAAEEIFLRAPNVEQVGFIWRDEAGEHLHMAGGEICFNALRAAAAWFLQDAVRANVRMCGRAYPAWREGCEVLTLVPFVDDGCGGSEVAGEAAGCQSPKIGAFEDILRAEFACNLRSALIDLGQIAHLCCLLGRADFERLSAAPDALKALCGRLLRQLGLCEHPACGLMLLAPATSTDADDAASTSTGGGAAACYELAPVVFVRDINSLFFESACGSGSFAAFSFLRALAAIDAAAATTADAAAAIAGSLSSLKLLQPSGCTITLAVHPRGITISSPVHNLATLIL